MIIKDEISNEEVVVVCPECSSHEITLQPIVSDYYHIMNPSPRCLECHYPEGRPIPMRNPLQPTKSFKETFPEWVKE
jgi:hypothetical protein